MTARKLMSTFALWRTLSPAICSLPRLSTLPSLVVTVLEETDLSISAHGIAETPANESGARFNTIPRDKRIERMYICVFFI
jgi:hypothetical protein